MARSKRFFEDLDEYRGCHDEDVFGLAPLGVGFLRRKQRYETGMAPKKFLLKLATYLLAPVCERAHASPCPLCGERVTTMIDGEEVILGSAEIRILGDEQIYAAPDLILHYITEHNYLPPKPFIDAVSKSVSVHSAEYRALIKSLA